MIEISRVPRFTHPTKVVIIGGGQSLKKFNFELLRNQDCFIIVVNESGKHVPFADAWFTLDPWGLTGKQLPNEDFNGQLWAAVPEHYGTQQARARNHRDVPTAPIKYLNRLLYGGGLSEDPKSIYTGNSGFGALGLAYHMRPKSILLLGIDGDKGYYYPSKTTNRDLAHLPRIFEDSLPQLWKHNIRVINGSPHSTVTCFPRHTPEFGLKILLSS